MSFKNEKEVLAAALDEFSSKRYDEASLNTIIRKSGISKGSFYHHFKNKYDIYIYVLKESLTKKWEFINSEISKDYTENTSEDIFTILSKQIKIGLKFGEKYPRYAALSHNLSQKKKNPIHEKVLKDLGYEINIGLESLITKSIEDGHFSNKYPDDFIVNMMKFFFNSYDEIFTDFNSIDSFLLFLKRGLGIYSNNE